MYSTTIGNNRRTNIVLFNNQTLKNRGEAQTNAVFPSPSAYGDDDNYQSDNGRAKSHKTAQTTGRKISDDEDDCISVYANDDQDNKPVLIQDNAEETDTISLDDTLKCLGEKFEEIEATCGNTKPQLAEIVQKRWHKKLSAEKLTFLQEKCMRPENCPEVRSMSVNPEIWAKLPHFQQQSDKNVSNIQESGSNFDTNCSHFE